jgi:aspartate ammonia-lyase
MRTFRQETDLIGSREIPGDALYGIHALRAKENFPDRTPFPPEWYKAVGLVKQACYQTCRAYQNGLIAKYPGKELPVRLIPEPILDALEKASKEVAEGKYLDHFIVPAWSGGAGTSINMNINEIIANVALIQLGKKPGDYKTIDPVEHANVFQSTNDVVPTALRVAVMTLLSQLEESVNVLRSKVEFLENAHRNDLRIGYTQMQEAVPSSFGKLFSSYSESFSRDWWRVSKCFERIKLVNLGGSAIGTGLAVPRFFIMEAIGYLQKLTNLPLARSENLADATSSLDSFVEIHAILKSHAVNLEKMVSDLRLLASDVAGNKEVRLPQQQAGSSIMPGKVNPVIPEFVISVAHRVYSNDQLITSLCSQGCLELNAYLPAIGCALIDSITLMIAADHTVNVNLLTGLTVIPGTGEEKLYHSPAVATALVPFIGYHKASELAARMKSEGIDIFSANVQLEFLRDEKLKSILRAENLLKLGYTMDDLLDHSVFDE